MSYQNILLESPIEPGIARVTLNKPENRNSMSLATLAELRDAFGVLHADESIRVVILTGSQKSFVSGGDTDFFLNTKTHFDNRDYLLTLYKTFNLIERLAQPVIAAVNGWAIGAGAELVASCDFAYAAKSARFSMPEVHMGMVSNIQAALFPHYASIGRVREWLFTGDAIDADEAAQWGLVNKVFPDEALMDAVMVTARKIAANPKIGVRFQKELVNGYWLRTDLETAMLAGPNFSAMSHATGLPKQLVREAVEARRAQKAAAKK